MMPRMISVRSKYLFLRLSLPASPQTAGQRSAPFGHVYLRAAPAPDNPERLRMLGSCVADNIVDVPIPQLQRTGISPPPATIRFPRLAVDQLRALWAAWEDAGLLDL